MNRHRMGGHGGTNLVDEGSLSVADFLGVGNMSKPQNRYPHPSVAVTITALVDASPCLRH